MSSKDGNVHCWTRHHFYIQKGASVSTVKIKQLKVAAFSASQQVKEYSPAHLLLFFFTLAVIVFTLYKSPTQEAKFADIWQAYMLFKTRVNWHLFSLEMPMEVIQYQTVMVNKPYDSRGSH